MKKPQPIHVWKTVLNSTGFFHQDNHSSMSKAREVPPPSFLSSRDLDSVPKVCRPAGRFNTMSKLHLAGFDSRAREV